MTIATYRLEVLASHVYFKFSKSKFHKYLIRYRMGFLA